MIFSSKMNKAYKTYKKYFGGEFHLRPAGKKSVGHHPAYRDAQWFARRGFRNVFPLEKFNAFFWLIFFFRPLTFPNTGL